MNKVFENTNKLVNKLCSMTLLKKYLMLSIALLEHRYKDHSTIDFIFIDDTQSSLVNENCINVEILRLKVIFDILLLELLNGGKLET